MKQSKFRSLILSLMFVQTIACSVLLFWGYAFYSQPNNESERSEAVALDHQSNNASCSAACNEFGMISYEELHSLMREAFQYGIAQVSEPEVVAVQTFDSPEKMYASVMSAELQEVAATGSEMIFTQALSLGVWTQGHTQALMTHAPNLSVEDRVALLEKFHGAVNRQELTLEDFPPL